MILMSISQATARYITKNSCDSNNHCCNFYTNSELLPKFIRDYPYKKLIYSKILPWYTLIRASDSICGHPGIILDNDELKDIYREKHPYSLSEYQYIKDIFTILVLSIPLAPSLIYFVLKMKFFSKNNATSKKTPQ